MPRDWRLGAALAAGAAVAAAVVAVVALPRAAVSHATPAFLGTQLGAPLTGPFRPLARRAAAPLSGWGSAPATRSPRRPGRT